MINVSGIFGKWKRYCDEMEVGDWKVTIESVTRATMQDFFLWGTSQENIRQFQQLHTTVTGRYPNRNDIKELYRYHDRALVPRFDLRAPNVDGKPVLNVDSLRLQRLNDSGCYMIICYTGMRPAELVHNERKPPKDGSLEELFGVKAVMAADDDADEEPDDPDSAELCALLMKETVQRDQVKALCYKDILMMVVRHPVTGRTTLAMSIKFIHRKGCYNKPKPTIFFFTRSKKLLFYPILLFLGITLFSDAFTSECLKDANSVFGTEVPAGYQYLPMRWKQSKLKTPFFRRVTRDGTVSDDQAMPGAANAANANHYALRVAPDSVRNQIMRHNPRYFMFQNAYLNQIAKFHLQNAFLEEEIEDQMFRLFAHVSLTRDPRAIRDMVPPEVWTNLAPDPKITKLEKRRAALKQGQYRFDGQKNEAKIRELTAKINSKRAQREKRIVKKYRENYFHHRPTWDLERQARRGIEEFVEPAIDLPDNLSDDEEMTRLSIEVVDFPFIDLDPPMASKRIKLEADPDIDFKPAPGPFPLLIHPNQYPECISDQRISVEERAFRYCRPQKRNDHFNDNHLEAKERAERLGQPIICNGKRCKGVKLHTVNHFRNHVQSVHKIKLRTTEQVQQRRARKVRLGRRCRSSSEKNSARRQAVRSQTVARA
ncbi:hypothetical protein F4779DRAFT_632530 [Xylariaceae sp. FL0662B]|nr:hypothetical protein F4779DRAFT_632530 [Xylariaceae sp. FL0662B]